MQRLKTCFIERGDWGPRSRCTCFWRLLVWSACRLLAVGFFGHAVTLSAEFPERILVPIDRPFSTAHLLALSGEGMLQLQSGTHRQEMQLKDLVHWGAPVEPRRGTWVLLGDGGTLIGDVLGLKEEKLLFESFLFGETQIPLNKLHGILLAPQYEIREDNRFVDQIRKTEGSQDTLWLVNGDSLSGTLIAWNKNKITFRMEGDQLLLERNRVKAFSLRTRSRSRVDEAVDRMLIGLRDGSLLLARDVDTQDVNSQVLTTLGKIRLQPHDSGGFTSAIVFLQPLGVEWVYLSDFEPLSYKHLPYFTMKWPYRRDRSVLGGPIRSGNRIYIKGLGMHSTSRLAYQLQEEFSRFDGKLAIDDVTNGHGSVVCRVYVDRTGEWQQVYESPVIRGGDAPVSFSIAVKGANRLSLIVDAAERGDVMDHVNWINARLVR